jgi:hypothetical protein
MCYCICPCYYVLYDRVWFDFDIEEIRSPFVSFFPVVVVFCITDESFPDADCFISFEGYVFLTITSRHSRGVRVLIGDSLWDTPRKGIPETVAYILWACSGLPHERAVLSKPTRVFIVIFRLFELSIRYSSEVFHFHH